jgi:hypothetical protein
MWTSREKRSVSGMWAVVVFGLAVISGMSLVSVAGTPVSPASSSSSHITPDLCTYTRRKPRRD